jgi:hypothetical protein
MEEEGLQGWKVGEKMTQFRFDCGIIFLFRIEDDPELLQTAEPRDPSR